MKKWREFSKPTVWRSKRTTNYFSTLKWKPLYPDSARRNGLLTLLNFSRVIYRIRGYTCRQFWRRFTRPFCQYLGRGHVSSDAKLNLSAYFINHCFAVLCKLLGDFLAFWERDIFSSKDRLNRGKYEMLKIWWIWKIEIWNDEWRGCGDLFRPAPIPSQGKGPGNELGLIRNRKTAGKKSPKTEKPQEISSKTENRNKTPHWQSFGRLQNLSFCYLTFIRLNFLLAEVLSEYWFPR